MCYPTASWKVLFHLQTVYLLIVYFLQHLPLGYIKTTSYTHKQCLKISLFAHDLQQADPKGPLFAFTSISAGIALDLWFILFLLGILSACNSDTKQCRGNAQRQCAAWRGTFSLVKLPILEEVESKFYSLPRQGWTTCQSYGGN